MRWPVGLEERLEVRIVGGLQARGGWVGDEGSLVRGIGMGKRKGKGKRERKSKCSGWVALR